MKQNLRVWTHKNWMWTHFRTTWTNSFCTIIVNQVWEWIIAWLALNKVQRIFRSLFSFVFIKKCIIFFTCGGIISLSLLSEIKGTPSLQASGTCSIKSLCNSWIVICSRSFGTLWTTDVYHSWLGSAQHWDDFQWMKELSLLVLWVVPAPGETLVLFETKIYHTKILLAHSDIFVL